jgi:hypothetical protein
MERWSTRTRRSISPDPVEADLLAILIGLLAFAAVLGLVEGLDRL